MLYLDLKWFVHFVSYKMKMNGVIPCLIDIWNNKQKSAVVFFHSFCLKKSGQGIEYHLKKVEKTNREREMCKLQLHFQMGFTCHFASVLMTVSGDMNSFYGFPYFFFVSPIARPTAKTMKCIYLLCASQSNANDDYKAANIILTLIIWYRNEVRSSIIHQTVSISTKLINPTNGKPQAKKKFLFCLQNIHLRQNCFDFVAI